MGLAKDDCGELMDRTVASSMIVLRPGLELKGGSRPGEHWLGENVRARRPVEPRRQPQILKNSLRRYIQRRMSQSTRRTATPWSKGA